MRILECLGIGLLMSGCGDSGKGVSEKSINHDKPAESLVSRNSSLTAQVSGPKESEGSTSLSDSTPINDEKLQPSTHLEVIEIDYPGDAPRHAITTMRAGMTDRANASLTTIARLKAELEFLRVQVGSSDFTIEELQHIRSQLRLLNDRLDAYVTSSDEGLSD